MVRMNVGWKLWGKYLVFWKWNFLTVCSQQTGRNSKKVIYAIKFVGNFMSFHLFFNHFLLLPTIFDNYINNNSNSGTIFLPPPPCSPRCQDFYYVLIPNSLNKFLKILLKYLLTQPTPPSLTRLCFYFIFCCKKKIIYSRFKIVTYWVMNVCYL